MHLTPSLTPRAAPPTLGIGINVAFAPELPPDIRPAICLREVAGDKAPTATQLGTDLVHALLDWLQLGDATPKPVLNAQVLKEWQQWVQFGQLYKIRETGEQVTTLGIQSDGQLKVRGANGQERLLMADYLH